MNWKKANPLDLQASFLIANNLHASNTYSKNLSEKRVLSVSPIFEAKERDTGRDNNLVIILRVLVSLLRGPVA
ncbi:hypothetical protein JTE90_024971 [Oedothorax gibbosus]|uniref:Uncharacterized protein n=1 Tax=Oedothorax gibbosus TaxID=931172 RepID=A0AAV6VVA4_9ARAC|nr:hypothetical protein JTE90_024971 [Oedothorax gibbosus]